MFVAIILERGLRGGLSGGDNIIHKATETDDMGKESSSKEKGSDVQ
jgi:hypothetical protein